MTWDAPPAFQFYVKDWVFSTRALTLEARALHLDLLALSWDKDGIPAEATEMIPHLGVITKAKFKKAWMEIECKWPLAEEGLRRNPRQERQRQEVIALREKRANAGRKSGAARNK